MRTLLFATVVCCAACPGGKPPETPPQPVEGQLGKPVALGSRVAFDGDAALVTLTTGQPAAVKWAGSGSETADDVPLTRDGARWVARLEHLPTNDDGTLVVQLGEGDERQTFMLEWSHASALESAESGLHSADGLFQLLLAPGDLPAGARLGVLTRPATMRAKQLVLGPYQVAASQAVHARGVFSLPPEPGGGWSRWRFASAQVLRSVDEGPFEPIASVAHEGQGRVAFTADAPASFALLIEEVQ